MSKLLKRVLSSLCSLVSTGVLSNAGSSAKRVKLQDSKTEIKKIGKSEGFEEKKKVNSTGKSDSLDEFIGSELGRNKSEGDKKFQIGGETVFGGALSRSRKEALRARGALSILKDDRIRDIVRNLDSDKLREMSKNNELISDILYGVFGTLNVVPFIPAILDGIRALRMELIFEQVLSGCEELGEEDKKVLRGVGEFEDLDLCIICLKSKITRGVYWEKESWSELKKKLKEGSNDLEEKVIKPLDEWRELWISFGGKNYPDLTFFSALDMAIIKVGWLLVRLLLSAPFAGVANNLSQRFQGRSNELGVIADKIDSLNKKNIGKSHESCEPYRGM